MLHPSPPLGGTAELAPAMGHSISEGSAGTTRARVSFDSDRSLPSFSQVRKGKPFFDRPRSFVRAYTKYRTPVVIQSKVHHSSDSSGRGQTHGSPSKDIPNTGIESPSSRSQSRANSPLRNIFRRPGAGHSREEPFIPVDPWKLRLKLRHLSESTARFGSHSTGLGGGRGDGGDHNGEGRNGSGSGNEAQRLGYEWCEYDSNACCCCLPSPISCPSPTTKGARPSLSIIFSQHFLTDALPRQLYLHFLLRLPSLYFSRVARIFEDADVSRPDIQRMIEACNSQDGDRPWSPAVPTATLPMALGVVGNAAGILGSTGQLMPYPEDWSPPAVSPALARFKNSWEAFIDSLMREWKTQNVVSALLLSSVVLQLHRLIHHADALCVGLF